MAEDEAGIGQDRISSLRCWAGRSRSTGLVHVAAWRPCSHQQKNGDRDAKVGEILDFVSTEAYRHEVQQSQQGTPRVAGW